jgi:hypothetical protein
LYHFRKIIVQPGGRLMLRGHPAVLLVEDMELQEGGQLITYAISHFTIGQLKKTDKPHLLHN